MKTKSTLFTLLIRETSQFLCYERLLNIIYVAYKNAFFREMQFWSHCYTVLSYQALFRLSVYKIPAVYLSGAKNVCFCTIGDFGSPTNRYQSTSARRALALLNSPLGYRGCNNVSGINWVYHGCAHVREITHSLKLVDYPHAHTDKPWYNHYTCDTQRAQNLTCRPYTIQWFLLLQCLFVIIYASFSGFIPGFA